MTHGKHLAATVRVNVDAFAVVSQEEEKEAQEDKGREWYCMMRTGLGPLCIWTVATGPTVAHCNIQGNAA